MRILASGLGEARARRTRPVRRKGCLVWRGGGGALAVLGIVFIALAFSGVRFTRSRWTREHEGPTRMIVGFAGLLLLLGRSGTILDLRKRTWRRWWGLLGPMHSVAGSLDDFQWVSLRREMVRTRGRIAKHLHYHVRLEGKRRLAFSSFHIYEEAREEAEEIALYLKLSLVDSSSGIEVHRESRWLGQSLRQRAREEGAPPDPGPPPGVMRSRVAWNGSAVRIDVPGPGFSGASLLLMSGLLAFSLIFLLGMMIPIWQSLPRRQAWGLEGLGVLVLTVTVPGSIAFAAADIIRKAMARTIVEASPDRLRISGMGFRPWQSREIASHAIEEISLFRFIIARSDAATISFGDHLPWEEKRWIRDVLHQVLSS